MMTGHYVHDFFLKLEDFYFLNEINLMGILIFFILFFCTTIVSPMRDHQVNEIK